MSITSKSKTSQIQVHFYINIMEHPYIIWETAKWKAKVQGLQSLMAAEEKPGILREECKNFIIARGQVKLNKMNQHLKVSLQHNQWRK